MTEHDIQQERHQQDRKLVRYRRAMEKRRMPSSRLNLAVEKYAATLEQEKRAVEAVRAMAEKRGVVRVAHRRLLDSLTRGCVGCVRNRHRSDWVEVLAEKAAMRLRHGMDEDLVFDAIRASLETAQVGGDVLEQVKPEARRMYVAAEQKTPEQKPGKLAVLGLGPARAVSKNLAKALEKPCDLELRHERVAGEELKKALALVKPWARRVVIDKLAKRKSYQELARENEMGVKDVKDILKQVRAFVHKYTTYFDDDWFWRDCAQTS